MVRIFDVYQLERSVGRHLNMRLIRPAINRRLVDSSYTAGRSVRRPRVRNKHRRQRLEWIRRHGNIDVSDESRFPSTVYVYKVKYLVISVLKALYLERVR